MILPLFLKFVLHAWAFLMVTWTSCCSWALIETQIWSLSDTLPKQHLNMIMPASLSSELIWALDLNRNKQKNNTMEVCSDFNGKFCSEHCFLPVGGEQSRKWEREVWNICFTKIAEIKKIWFLQLYTIINTIS